MDGKYTLTPAGICEAARAGDVRAIDLILASRPELLIVDNPHNWTKTVPGHQIRGSYNKKPVEVAAFFNQPQAVVKLLEIARDSHAIRKPWVDHLPFDGHFDSLGVARAMGHDEVIEAIEADVLKRIYVRPKLLNAVDSEGRTPLCFAAAQGHMPLVRTLLEQGANADPELRSGNRVIYKVLSGESNEERRSAARLLIEHGAAIDLWIAVALEDVVRVKKLLEADSSLANQRFPPGGGLSDGFPLVRACANGNREIVELLLGHGADINAELGVADPPEFGMSIIAAIYARHYEIANMLLDRGASADAHPNCAAPLVDMLYYASVEQSADWLALGELKHVTDDARSHLQPNDSGSTEAVELYSRVVSQGANPQIYSRVKMKDHTEIERLLREEPESTGRNPGGSDTVFNCLSHAAAWLGNVKTMELCHTLQPQLLSAQAANEHIRAAIRSHNRDGSFADYRRIVELNLQYLKDSDSAVSDGLLALLADDFLENYSYGTCLELPSMADLLELAELLLTYGADINFRDENGDSALSVAVDHGHEEYVQFLLKHGAIVHRDDPPNTNPVSLARKHGFSEILKLLGESATS